jgi:hypothetical protein
MIRPLCAVFLIVAMITILPGCKYRKGDGYTTTLYGDSLNYVILTEGKGRKVSKKAAELKYRYELKGDLCQIRYLSDSASLNGQRGILLFNSVLPEIKNDILSGGFISSFASRQEAICLIVADQDFEKFFKKKKSE